MKSWLSARLRGSLHLSAACFGWLLANLRDIIGLLALIALGVGCAMERPSLGLIVPSVIVLAMLTYSEIRSESDEKVEKDAD